MNIIGATSEIIFPFDDEGLINECKKIEKIGRVCYKSEDKITNDSWKKFVLMLRKNKHGAMLEHSSLSVKFITSRGVTHELVRHRLASFAQESTRYCSYNKDKFGNEITVISPFVEKGTDSAWNSWKLSCEEAEKQYFNILKEGFSPQIARAVLPTSLKAEICVTANFREWLHIFDLRISKFAHPEICILMLPLYKHLHKIIPEVFTIDRIEEEFNVNSN
jgi:thymidylate synthase (FAD)